MGRVDMGQGQRDGLSRREVIAAAAAAGAAALWRPAFTVGAAEAASTGCALPPSFPAGIGLFKQAFQNWAKEIITDDLWSCTPRSAADLLVLADWAAAHGYRLRARGMMHTWSPLTVTRGESCAQKVVLMDLTKHFAAMQLLSSDPGLVQVGAGATMQQLMAFLKSHGLGFTATPAPGDVTVGGVLAIDGHGTAIPARGEQRLPGHTYGTLSNMVVSLTAVVWDRRRRAYRLRTFHRSESDCAAFLVHLGRALVTEVQLRVGVDTKLRCVSHMDIPASELFASPGSKGRTFASFMDSDGRAEAIWFPFTDYPWMKVWSVAPVKPAASRETDAPFNYVFADSIPEQISDLAGAVMGGQTELTPLLGPVSYAVSVAGLQATRTADLWGASMNTLLYVKPSTLRATANGSVVLCARADIQRTIHDFTTFYTQTVDDYAAQGRYPAAVAIEIRVTGLDDPSHVGVPGARSPVLSAARPRPDHPEWDVAVWFDVLTFPAQPDSQEFYRKVEQWMLGHFGDRAVRPEWSKGWAYSGSAPWDDAHMLSRDIPAVHRAGRRAGDDFDWAVRTLDRHDPHRVFSNPFLDRLLVARAAPRRKKKRR